MKDKLKSAAKAPAKAARAKMSRSNTGKSAAKSKTANARKPKAEPKARGTKAAKAASTITKTGTDATAQATELSLKTKPIVDVAVKTAKARARADETAPRTKRAAKPAGMKTRKKKAGPSESSLDHREGRPVVDPIGDTTDGEGRIYLGGAATPTQVEQTVAEVDAFRTETAIEASDAALEAGPGMEAAREATEARARSEAVAEAGEQKAAQPEMREPGKLERLQKILSQAGIASRRRAEEMITEGRVMVNGQVVTTLGSKADPARDHIRVDGKLLHGAERHRYFLLNKPKGFVTTVSDPEGRPTVMQFFEKMHERLYPVGRLDYQSEGLLLMTNDGELANLLTKAGSGVEKTYLVKVAGQPSEQELERLREGVEIERGETGSGRVRTAPARVRQVREGDNPWFEVVLIEGRNRELRKMFAAVGHYVEKIRRVGYGPLALDVEPGKLRELSADEVTALRLTAEGKMKPRHLKADRMLPKDAGRAAEERVERPRRDAALGRGGRVFGERGGKDFGRRKGGGFERREGGGFAKRDQKPFQPRGERGPGREWKPRVGEFQNRREGGGLAKRDQKPFQPRGERGPGREWKPRVGEFQNRREGGKFRRGEQSRSGGPREFGGKRGERAGFGGRQEGRSFGGAKPRFERQEFGGGPRRERGEREFGGGGQEPYRARGERPHFKRDAGPQRRQEDAPVGGFETKPRKNWGARPGGRASDRPRGESRGPRQPAPEFRGQGRKFGGGKAKPAFGGRPSGFRGDRGRGGPRPGEERGFGGGKRG